MVLALVCVSSAGAEYEAGQQAWDAGQDADRGDLPTLFPPLPLGR